MLKSRQGQNSKGKKVSFRISLEHEEEGDGVCGEEDDEEGDPVERLPLDLLVVLLPQLQLPVRLRQPEEDLGEAGIALRFNFNNLRCLINN